MSRTTATAEQPRVDPRGLRVSAAITAAVLVVVLLTPEPFNVVLLAVQVAVFALSSVAGLRWSPYSFVFATLVRPRIGAPLELEDSRPPRFAQVVGLLFTTISLISLLAGATTLGLIATGFALVAALLNATVGLCLGCELYLVIRRLAPSVA